MIIAYGAIIYAVIQDLADRRVSIAQAVAIATRRLSLLVGVLAATVVLGSWTAGLVLQRAMTEAATREAAAVFAVIVTLIYLLVMAMYSCRRRFASPSSWAIGAALSRCRFLAKGHRWQNFVAILLVGILDVAIGILCTCYAPCYGGPGLGGNCFESHCDQRHLERTRRLQRGYGRCLQR